jgi:hypothetical protein
LIDLHDSLEAERDRLRAALERIADSGQLVSPDLMRKIAREALAGAEK